MAALQSFGQQAYAQSPQTDDHVGKRRRVDDAAHSQASRNVYGQWVPPTYPIATTASYGDGMTSSYAMPAQRDSNLSIPSYAHRAPDAPNGQWQQPAYNASTDGFVPSYQDMRSMQQPYYYGQTDPSVYNSPWPPTQPTHSSSTSSAAYTASPNPAVSYAQQSQTPVGSTHGYETNGTPAYPTGLHDFDVGAYQVANHASHHQQHPQPREPTAMYFDDASMHLKMQSLQSLDNLAEQLILTIAKCSFTQIQDFMRNSDDEESQAYSTLKNLFDQTRRVYSRDTPFIDAITIQMFQPNQQETIRKANIATFVTSILGAHDVSFFHLNEYFMETFVPLGHRLLKWQGAIYLELKTQTYISALINSDSDTSPDAMLEKLFPQDLAAQILTRHPDFPSLSPSEQDFIDRCKARRSYLLAEPSSEEAIRELPKKYQWPDFLREFAASISKNIDSIISSAPPSSAIAQQQPSDRTKTQSSTPPRNPATKNSTKSSTPTSASATAAAGATSSTPTIRQPWTKPEEDALISGLERVSGPHWSQILALYGRGGSVSEVLKDRNQVQLKDKARNLKLWYLKTGREVPDALKGVTGELRKRGGARARAFWAAREAGEAEGAGN